MEEYLVLVEATKECPNDEAFAAQIRLQLFAHKVVEFRESHALNHSDASKIAATNGFSDLLYLKTIQTQLRGLESTLSSSLQQQGECLHFIRLQNKTISHLPDLANYLTTAVVAP